MSNTTCLVATKFTNIAQENEESYGFRLYDNYGQNYDNLAEGPITDDLELLKWAIENHPPCASNDDDIADALGDVKSNASGMEINGKWYDWDEIKHLFG
jgi:hypothetical protein